MIKIIKSICLLLIYKFHRFSGGGTIRNFYQHVNIFRDVYTLNLVGMSNCLCNLYLVISRLEPPIPDCSAEWLSPFFVSIYKLIFILFFSFFTTQFPWHDLQTVEVGQTLVEVEASTICREIRSCLMNTIKLIRNTYFLGNKSKSRTLK